MIPLILKMQIFKKRDETTVKLALPLFIAWLLLFPLLAALTPLAALASLFIRNGGYLKLVLRTCPAIVSILCSLSGLVVTLENRDRRVMLLFP
jgi:hypothetical protein